MQITELKHIHFTGIKGVAMTSLALCAQDAGIKITGSDVEEEFVTDEILKARGITWSVGFSEKNLEPKPDLVITTGAHGGLNNPEVLAAKELGIPVLTHAEALGEFVKDKKLITVAGVGGKTTTSSMISQMLDFAGLRPSFAVGVGNIYPLGTPGKYLKLTDFFVTEADEFAISPGIDNRPRFTYQNPHILIVTNIEHDHPDIYPTFEDTKKTFLGFMSRVDPSGSLIVCIDNENVRELLKSVPEGIDIQTYGFSEDADWKVQDMPFKLKVPGKFNLLNATAAFAAGKLLEEEDEKLINGLEAYEGCERRIQKVGEKDGILFYDDYAHNPHEIVSVLQAIKEFYPGRRIVCTFQPHTYSRTKRLLPEFAKAFNEADLVGLSDVYSSARETDTLGMNSEILTNEIKKNHPSPDNVRYTKSLENTTNWLKENLKEGDICLTLGAGDIYKIHRDLK